MLPRHPDSQQDPKVCKDLFTLMGHLSAADPDVVQAAVRQLKALGGSDTVTALIPLLSSPDPGRQIQAMDILVASGPRVLSHLGTAMETADSDMRKIILDIIRRVITPEAEEYLIRFLFDEDVNVGVAAAEALGASGTKAAVPHLIQCLDKEPWLQCAALKSLGKIGSKTALPAIINMGHATESVVRFCAVQAVGSIAHVDGVDFVLSILDTGEAALVPHVIQALIRIFTQNPQAQDQLLTRFREKIDPCQLVACLEKNNRTLVAGAVTLLGLLGDPMALAPLLSLYKPANAALFEGLAEAIVRLNPRELTPFEAVLEDPQSTDAMKLSVVDVLGRLDSPAAARFLMAFYGRCHPDLKPDILTAMVGFAHGEVRDFLHGQLVQENNEIRLSTLDALARHPHDSSIPFLMGLSAASSSQVRTRAADILSRLDLGRHQPEIGLGLVSSDDSLVVFYLGMMTDALVPAFKDHLRKLCCHENADIRKKAVERLALQGDAPALAAVKPCLNDSHAMVRRAAVRALVRFDPEMVASLLIRVVENDPDHWNRYEAVMGIKALSISSLMPYLLKGLPHYPDLVKVAILDLLGEQGTPDNREHIEAFVNSPMAVVKEAAQDALTKIRS